MFFPFDRPSLAILALAAPLLLAACQTPPPQQPVATPADTQANAPGPAASTIAKPQVRPVEVELIAPATRPGFLQQWITPNAAPVVAMLSYADRVRALGNNELSAELARLGDPGDAPEAQMQVALVLAQTRVPADLARALGLMQRVAANASSEAQPLQPLARTLAARYMEQRRVEDDRDRQLQQARDAQRRIDQLNDRLEALRAIERSFARPNHSLPATGGGNLNRPASP
ncbi:hypothetical protein [Variovorax ginsengisoli]|uniref:Lipoprotein n=1 Tax=Variovorax ginsengisoli TaxID=363844 RepID=A0ABT9SBD2_9BURK|nr:hypothetical protein [Variovorax ginsengisoli]MDP9900667.1 hypothetical protein [Variovorax ginsengisoli]